jgi:alkyl hydroperoxide reductase subunit AhpF
MTLFRPDEEQAVRDLLEGLDRPVELALVLGPEPEPLPGARDIDFAAETRKILEGLVELSPNLSLTVQEGPAFDVELYPAICVLPAGEDVGIRYYGLPWGYELTSVVGACIEAGRVDSSLSAESQAALAGLERDLSLEIFVTPT